MYKIIISLLLFFPYYLNSYNPQPRKEKLPMTTSVIVPCVARHFFWLSGLLESYQNQTVHPNEVVISLSEVEKLSSKEIDDLEKGKWNFNLKILRNNGIILDGENRTIAMDHATGDILIFSDADDLVHPQRVEIAKYIFENYIVDHILHSYSFSRDKLISVNKEQIPTLHFGSIYEVIRFARTHACPITTGSPCFISKIGKQIKWHSTQDVEYNNAVYHHFKNTIVIPVPLILYRSHLSSHRA